MAESCTGGLAGALITEASGASVFFRGAVVAYSDEVKTALLEVPAELLAFHGAVSSECVELMASSVAARCGATVGWAISGVAGPGGGSAEKPVGLVWQGAWCAERARARRFRFRGERDEVRRQAVLEGAEWLATCLES